MRLSRRGLARWTAALATTVLLVGTVGSQQKPVAACAKSAAAARAARAGPAAPSTCVCAQRFATLCAACHGANGRGEMAGVPVLAGQPSFYSITQLFLFREGRRSNEAMTAVAKTLKDDDLRGVSEFIGTLPPVPAPPPATPPDAARMATP